MMPAVLSIQRSSRFTEIPSELIICILRASDVRTLLTLRQTCRSLHVEVNKVLTFKLHSLVTSFVDEPRAFFSMLDRTHSVVSGSLALHFLLEPGDLWRSGDMDLYTPRSCYAQVLDFMCSLGYVPFHDFILHRYYGNHFAHTVTKLRHPLKEWTVDVISPSTDCAVAAMFAFYGMHIINWISGSEFYSAYPKLTFRGISIVDPILIDWPEANLLVALQKYQSRGIRFVPDYRVVEDEDARPPHVCEDDLYCSLSVRSTVDGHGMSMSLDGLGVEPATSAEGPYPGWAVSWRWGGYGHAICREADVHPMIEPFVLLQETP